MLSCIILLPTSGHRQVIGSPSEEELGFITSEKAKRYIRSLPKSERVNFHQLWPNVNPTVRCGSWRTRVRACVCKACPTCLHARSEWWHGPVAWRLFRPTAAGMCTCHMWGAQP